MSKKEKKIIIHAFEKVFGHFVVVDKDKHGELNIKMTYREYMNRMSQFNDFIDLLK